MYFLVENEKLTRFDFQCPLSILAIQFHINFNYSMYVGPGKLESVLDDKKAKVAKSRGGGGGPFSLSLCPPQMCLSWVNLHFFVEKKTWIVWFLQLSTLALSLSLLHFSSCTTRPVAPSVQPAKYGHENAVGDEIQRGADICVPDLDKIRIILSETCKMH